MILWLGGAVEGLEQSTPVSIFEAQSVNTNLRLFFYFSRIVEFASYSDVKNALEKLSGTELNGRKIRVVEESKPRR